MQLSIPGVQGAGCRGQGEKGESKRVGGGGGATCVLNRYPQPYGHTERKW